MLEIERRVGSPERLEHVSVFRRSKMWCFVARCKHGFAAGAIGIKDEAPWQQALAAIRARFPEIDPADVTRGEDLEV